MKIDLEGIKKRTPAAMSELMSVVKRSSHIGCSKVGAEFMEDDVAQAVMMLFLSKLIDKFDQEYNAEPYLIKTARLVAMSMMRQNRELSLGDGVELPEMEINDINTHNSIEPNPVSVLDQQKALRAIMTSFPGIVPESKKSEADPKRMVKKRTTAKRELSESCGRLRQIRLDLGMPQELFSGRLGIPNATLLSYEYGRTPNVPEHLMEKAEEIFKSEQTVAKRNQAQAERSMEDYINEWATLLMIDPNDFKTLSEIIGVAKSTIHRWNDNEMRPRPRELNSYIRTVKLAAKRIKSVEELSKFF